MGIVDLLHDAIKRNASDVHIAVGYPPMYRIDGRIVMTRGKALAAKVVETMMREVIDDKRWAEFQLTHEMDFAYEEEAHRFRMNAHKERGHVALAARIIRGEIPSFEEIGLPEAIHDLIQEPNGLIIVTGPAGTGKSTTLAAMIAVLNRTQPSHIVTLEDPIEFVYPNAMGLVKQREIGTDTHTFATGLKHALRQDPDVLMVGEMRDLETMSAVLTLAETGHLVFSTLHTRSAATTISRIIDSFPPSQQEQARLQLAISLRAVISQILLPRAKGGLVAAREIMINNVAIANLIRTNKTEQITNVIQTSKKEGMVTLEQDIKQLVKDGVVSDIVAMKYA